MSRALSDRALGTTAGGTTVSTGAAPELSGGITPGEAIAITGTGILNGGALRSIAGNDKVTGAVTLTADSRFTGLTSLQAGVLARTGAGALAMLSVNVTNGASQTTDGGALAEAAAVNLQFSLLGYGNRTLIGGETIGARVGAAGSTVTPGANRLTLAGNVQNAGVISLNDDKVTGVLTAAATTAARAEPWRWKPRSSATVRSATRW